MKTSQAGVNLIKLFEGLRFDAYYDAVGVLTIGYGHTGPDVKINSRVNEQQAEILLKKDLERFENTVRQAVKVPLNQFQFDALVSFCFNVGSAAFIESSLLRRLNAKEDPYVVAKEELPRWNKGDKGQELAGLTRRRSAEIELFTQPAPQTKTGLITIAANAHTYLKKQPLPSETLPNDQKARIYQNREIKNCTILERKNNHTYLELGFGLGKWWVFDPHWRGLETQPSVNSYATEKDLYLLRDFPYFYQQDNGPEGWRQCQTSSIAMCLRYLDVPGIKDDVDYLKVVNKYGDTTRRDPHFQALASLNVQAKFLMSANAQDVKDEIRKGLPVVAGILHHGAYTAPTGSGHFVVITGYGKDYWLVQDPYGALDLINGGWAKRGAVDGKNIKYPFKYFNPRFFVGGGSDGWAWLGFKKK